MNIKQNFTKGKMNKDLDERLVPNGEFIHAENIRISSSSDSDIGAIENVMGTIQKSNITLNNGECIGAISDNVTETIYWFVKSDRFDYVFEYDKNTEATTIVLQDTKGRVLKFDVFITGINILNDIESGKRFLIWTDGTNHPRFINIERAKTYGLNGFIEDDIMMYKKPPLKALTYQQYNTPTITNPIENNMREVFLMFSYRYKYLDGQYSALAPFTQSVFMPTPFNYNLNSNDNVAMVNAYNSIILGFNSGDSRVVSIELVFKESGANNVYIIEEFKKEDEGWIDNTLQNYTFINNKIYKVLPELELFRLYDNVPKTALAQCLIGGRILYGNYRENYNIDKKIDFKAKGITEVVSENNVGIPYKQLKSNRDYEIAISYLDDVYRFTTPLTSKENTVFFPNGTCDDRNKIQVEIKNQAPSFAKYFRFWIKQSKTDYDTIVPTIFYEDKNFLWIKLDAGNKDKVKEGDYLIVKQDNTSTKPNEVKIKVIEIKDQPENFLDTSATGINQVAGLYMKIEQNSNFVLNLETYRSFSGRSYNNTRYSPFVNILYANYIEDAVYYGANPSANGNVIVSGSYTPPTNQDRRYTITITGITPTTVSYDISILNTENNTVSTTNGTATLDISQALTGTHGIIIEFKSVSGVNPFQLGDIFVISAKTGTNPPFVFNGTNGKAFAFVDFGDEPIDAGSVIKITLNQYYPDMYPNSPTPHQRIVNINQPSSQNYANIEEWFYGDNILSLLATGFDVSEDDMESKIYFKRGELGDFNRNISTEFKQDLSQRVVMIIQATDNIDGGGRKAFISNYEVLTPSRLAILETEPLKDYSDIFYELPETYTIDENGNHIGLGSDANQSGAGTSALITLSAFNCFGWGNGFESWKIKDNFNSNKMKIDTRPNSPIIDYKENNRTNSITFSGVYEQSTSLNNINVFNLALANYKDLNPQNNSIQVLHPNETDIEVYCEDKVVKVLYDKNAIFEADGTLQLVSGQQVLGQEISYLGDYGIGVNRESFAVKHNARYFVDGRRGFVLRLSNDGLTPISENGMSDYIRDRFRNYTNGKKMGGYDPDHEEYVFWDGTNVLVYSESVQGFPSFHTYQPDYFVHLLNDFYSFKNGNLHIHNNGAYNNFYGVQYNSKMDFYFNDAPSDIKVLKSISFEGNTSWKSNVKAFLNNSTNFSETNIPQDQFIEKEGLYFAYMRRNELNNTNGLNVYGIGQVQSITGNDVFFASPLPFGINVGDVLSNTSGVIGSIDEIGLNRLSLSTSAGLSVGDFVFATKNAIVDGAVMRGYVFKLALENNNTNKIELFAVNGNVFKSFP